MSRISKTLFLLLASFAAVGLIASGFDAAAKDKTKEEKKKDDKKDDKKDKKEEKIEKKEPFKPDAPAQEFKPDEKEKPSFVETVAFGGDGKTVAVAYKDFSVKVWDLGTTKAQAFKLTDVKGVGTFFSLAYAPDQIYVGSGHLIKREKTKVKEKERDKDKPKDKDKDKDKKEPVKELPFREGEIRTFDAKSVKPGKSLGGIADDVLALALSKDGKTLASGGKDQLVKIWDRGAGTVTQTIKGHSDDVTFVGFSGDGKRVVTASLDRTLRVFEIADAKEIASWKIEREVEVKDPKGKVTKKKEDGRDFTAAVFTPDGKKIIAGNREGMIKIYEVEGKKELQELKAHEGILTVALSPDGTKFATGGYDGIIKIWSVADGKTLKTIKAHLSPSKTDEPGSVITLNFSPDNQWLASGGADGVVKIWSVK